ncbi:MAG: hypothetical protein FWG05_06235, partial [Kiritimatiellaeota bacterium]|nr:hypothetical protein [Kiritimatiellota bacterium]
KCFSRKFFRFVHGVFILAAKEHKEHKVFQPKIFSVCSWSFYFSRERTQRAQSVSAEKIFFGLLFGL